MLSPRSPRLAGACVRVFGQVVRPLVGSIVLLVLAVVASGCTAKAKAANAPAIPPLSVPAPPPRELPQVEQTAVTASIPPDVPITESTPSVVAKPAPSTRAANQDTTKVQPPAQNTGGLVGPPETPRDARAVRPEDVAEQKRIEDTARQMLNTTNTALKNIDPAKLTSGNKQHYEDAKQYVEDAQKALKEGRLSYALVNADKAMKIAQQLAR